MTELSRAWWCYNRDAEHRQVCKTAAAEGDIQNPINCEKHVRWAMHHGIYEHPDWYPGMTNKTSTEAFRCFLALSADVPECKLRAEGCQAWPILFLLATVSLCCAISRIYARQRRLKRNVLVRLREAEEPFVVDAYNALVSPPPLPVEAAPVPVDEQSLGTRSILQRFGDDREALSSMIANSSLDNLEFGGCIGRGGTSVVYSAVWKGERVALKHLKLGGGTDESVAQNVLKEFTSEVKIMCRLSHPHVIRYIGFTVEPLCLIIQELATEGDLHTFLTRFNAASTPPPPTHAKPKLNLQIQMAEDIARGMEYLHSQQPPVLHRDLKTPNLLLDADLRVKITDFGIAREKFTGSSADEEQEVKRPYEMDCLLTASDINEK